MARTALTGCLLVTLFGVGAMQTGTCAGAQDSCEDIPIDPIGRALQNAINGENIKANLRLLTKEAHQAGTPANEREAKKIEKMYKDAGLTNVHTLTYDVLLSYPDWEKPNTVSIRDPAGNAVFTSTGVTLPILPEQEGPHAGNQWLAYSAPGTVEGDVVYAHVGLPADFETLKKNGVDLKGKIALMRYGYDFRGDMVAFAESHGAIAALLYSDPAEVAQGHSDDVFPKSTWMPSDGVQRGSIMKLTGDPLTPLYPAKPGAYKSKTIDENKADGNLPSIPALPISFSTAYQIFSRMGGNPAPAQWQGGLNLTYRLGPGLINGYKIVVDVRSTLESRQIHNVVGYLPGHEEEDRYVILGNHFDAWTFGSNDPNAGTSILAEVARAMVETTNSTKWKPARSIMFAAWDAEEYGLIGSTEFVEEFVTQLGNRAVAYVNMDCILNNISLGVDTVPSMRSVVIDVAKRIPNHLQSEVKLGRKTLYDTWVHTIPGKNGQPYIPTPGGGTDYVGFLSFTGVPIIDFSMVSATTKSQYPLYHTLFETPFLNEHLMDQPNFAMHVAIGRYWAELARTLADSPLLPINVTAMAAEMVDVYVGQLNKTLIALPANANLLDAKQQVDLLEKAAADFLLEAEQFTKYARENAHDQRKLRGVNERIMMTERCFINPRGSPGAPQMRHVLYSPSVTDSYSGSVMTAFYEAVDNYKNASDSIDAGRKVAQQISVIYHAVNCATNTLTHFI